MARVISRRSHGRRRMLRKPSITICPASVPVSVEFCPEASNATANRMLANVTRDAARNTSARTRRQTTRRTLNEHEQRREITFDKDEGPRRDSSAEALAKLRPAFHVKGTITAGNSSQMSDGAAAAIVMSAERAKELGAKPLARLVAYATAGCPPEEMGIGPVYAIPKALKLAGLTLDQIDVIELNEAFAAQSLAVIKMLELNPDRVNVNGGAIALGHPLGCTGAKLTASILRELERRNGRYGMVTMCVGGGMGAAGIFERL